MFMEVAIAGITIGIALMLGYVVISQVRQSLPTIDNESSTAINNTQITINAGFALVAVGILVLAAWGIIMVFK